MDPPLYTLYDVLSFISFAAVMFRLSEIVSVRFIVSYFTTRSTTLYIDSFFLSFFLADIDVYFFLFLNSSIYFIF